MTNTNTKPRSPRSRWVRTENIREGLAAALRAGTITDWGTYSPGDRKGRRWQIIPNGSTGVTYTTRETEAFLTGIEAASTRNVRTAVVTGGARNLDQVRAYLPGNYHANQYGPSIVIVGRDYAGWTLDDYVIPRLASGLVWVEEVH